MADNTQERRRAARKMASRSRVWERFTSEDGKDKARCKCCLLVLQAGTKSGTSTLWNHVTKTCKGQQQEASGAWRPPSPSCAMATPRSLDAGAHEIHYPAAIGDPSQPGTDTVHQGQRNMGLVPLDPTPTVHLLPARAPRRLPRGVQQRHWGKWVAEIRSPWNHTRLRLGTFDTAEEAGSAGIRRHGPAARLNFPEKVGGRCSRNVPRDEAAAQPVKQHYWEGQFRCGYS